MTRTKAVQVKKLTTTKARQLFNRQAKQYAQLSGPEFIKRWDAGRFNGKAATPAVMRVVMLLPFGR